MFSKAEHADLRDRLLATVQGGDPAIAGRLAKGIRLGEQAFSAAPVAQIVVANDGVLMLANELARSMFGLEPTRRGPATSRTSSCPIGPSELRALMEKALGERTTANVTDVERAPCPAARPSTWTCR